MIIEALLAKMKKLFYEAFAIEFVIKNKLRTKKEQKTYFTSYLIGKWNKKEEITNILIEALRWECYTFNVEYCVFYDSGGCVYGSEL
jgi:hypothetical protein